MAVIAGAGNPVGGSNPTGTGSGLNYISDFAYAFSGEISATGDTGGATVTMLDFTTGGTLFVGTLDFSNSVTSGTDVFLEMSLDGQNVITLEEDSDPNHPGVTEFKIIIPPFSKVSVKWGLASGTKVATAIMQGRVYA